MREYSLCLQNRVKTETNKLISFYEFNGNCQYTYYTYILLCTIAGILHETRDLSSLLYCTACNKAEPEASIGRCSFDNCLFVISFSSLTH